MQAISRSNRGAFLVQLGWGTLAVICVVYGAYALASAVSELAFILGLGPEAKHRATPVVFVIHAFAGAAALLAAPWQLNAAIRRHVSVHRALGRIYVTGVWIASASAVLEARSFAVSVVAKAVFAGIAALWFTVTTVAYLRVRARRFSEHREWMLRSVSLSFFFVTFSVWVPALAQSPLPASVAYPLALLLSGGLNLGAAEWWIRHTRESSWPRASAASQVVTVAGVAG